MSWILRKDRNKAEQEQIEAQKKEIRGLVYDFTGRTENETLVVPEIVERKEPPAVANVSQDVVRIDKVSNVGRFPDNSVCTICGARVEKDYRYCPGCAAVMKKECHGCHELSPVGYKVCPRCGRTFSRVWNDVRGD